MYRVPSSFPKPPSWKQRLAPVLLAMAINAAVGWVIGAFLIPDQLFYWIPFAGLWPLVTEFNARQPKYIVRSTQSVIRSFLISGVVFLVFGSLIYNLHIIGDKTVLAAMYGGMVGLFGNLTHYLIVERLFARHS